MTTRPLTDAHGIPTTGDAEAVALYDRAIDRFVRFHPDVVTHATELAMQDQPIPMSHALVAYLHITSTDQGDVATAADAAAALAATAGTDRERGHARALSAWTSGDWHGAAKALDDVLQDHPTDLLALMMGHQLAFFVGDAVNLRDRPARSLRALDPEHPHTGFVKGMLAFGLEEAGHYAQALEVGRAAVAADGEDVWAVHAVAHAHEMQGQVVEGIRFLESTLPGVPRENLFAVHNWWHLAIYLLEAGRSDRSLQIYDEWVHHEGSQCVPLEMVDASALLWRLRLHDEDTGGRFAPLADAWAAKVAGEPWYAFNDLHATLALVGAGRIGEARERIRVMDRWLESGTGSNVRMTAEIGLPSCRAVVAFDEGRYDDVVADLFPIRRVLQNFGGSHAQRDVLQRTLLEAALRGGRYELARSLSAERLAVRETSPYSWAQHARALQGLGAAEAAGRASATAAAHLAPLAHAAALTEAA